MVLEKRGYETTVLPVGQWSDGTTDVAPAQ